MDLLLDTHAFLWFVWNDSQLSIAARSLIVDPANRKLISAASHWEIAIKVSVGKLNLGEPFLAFMHREITRNNFELLPVSLEHSAAVSVLPFHHRDPFDRMLVAQANVDTIPIVSADVIFDAYAGVRRLW
jgi:PIN domain nuclease of toxin-antitoxin system